MSSKIKQDRANHGFQCHLSGKAKQSEITVFVWKLDNKNNDFFFQTLKTFAQLINHNFIILGS